MPTPDPALDRLRAPEPEPILVDSIAEANPAMADRVVVCGSHGGRSAAHYVLALRTRPRAVFFNDAGIGKDEAGIVALAMLEAAGVIAAVYDHDSARIGDATDGWANGRISRSNPSAAAAGVTAGMAVSEAARLAGSSTRPS
jgi:hypothetical protein